MAGYSSYSPQYNNSGNIIRLWGLLTTILRQHWNIYNATCVEEDMWSSLQCLHYLLDITLHYSLCIMISVVIVLSVVSTVVVETPGESGGGVTSPPLPH